MTQVIAPLERPLAVTRPVLPSLESYVGYLESIWSTHTLTNLGPLHQQLESAIGARIGVGQTTLWNNGMTALLGALQVLDLRGEVVVTPFTFPATVHAIALLGLTPVFADIDDDTLTLDPAAVSEALTVQTSAILGTHVYGQLSDTASIGAIARERGLRVVYDGAHSFARQLPLFERGQADLGDITMLSFHATKLFHSVEGGALVTTDPELDRRLRLARNFGIKSEVEVEGIGLNGKMSEVHAAMGLAMLDLLDDEIAQRKAIAAEYVEALADIPGLRIAAGRGDSVQYFVVRIDADQFGSGRDELQAGLRSMNVFSRRYFHPLCSDLPAYSHLPSARRVPVARKAASEVLALPFHGGLSAGDAVAVADIIRWHQDGNRL
jgi:dTDP-4-amino-4,6-dideoxygalactose transaminase